MKSFYSRPYAIAPALAIALLGWCASPMSAHAASQDEQAHACRGDALHFCKDDVPDKAKITACMKQHYEQLSPACKAMFNKPQATGRHKS